MGRRVIPLLAAAVTNQQNGNLSCETIACGLAVLHSPLLNKGTAFTADKRKSLGLTGLLPPESSTLETQVRSAYIESEHLPDALSKNIYLAEAANDEGLARVKRDEIVQQVPDAIWRPDYRHIQGS